MLFSVSKLVQNLDDENQSRQTLNVQTFLLHVTNILALFNFNS